MNDKPKQLVWRTAIASGGGDCVQIANDGGHVAVRDSKDPNGPILRFPPGAVAELFTTIKGDCAIREITREEPR